MSYQVLARKWRPRDFSSLVGQDHVVRALSHALSEQRLHHAYLFTGTRGVGKTTLSRILAKALNCETGITPNPCGVCRACREIDAGRFVDYVEMDAASNRGVDEMAALLERAVYAPVDARFKVYMIDEVHMLTNHAFNAMLKTLEEPPPYVKFILATTDPQKIPVTVLSRCLQFNLKQMPPGDIVAHLGRVLEAESITFETPALRLLARAADGSMRDALSLTDQAIAYAAGTVSEQAVRGMLGTLDQGYLVRLLECLDRRDGPGLLGLADEMAERSLSFSVALQDLAQWLHRIAWAQFAPASLLPDAVDVAEVERFAAGWPAEQVQLYYQIATLGRSELPLAPDEYAGFTMTLLRMLAFAPSGAAVTVATSQSGTGTRGVGDRGAAATVPDAEGGALARSLPGETHAPPVPRRRLAAGSDAAAISATVDVAQASEMPRTASGATQARAAPSRAEPSDLAATSKPARAVGSGPAIPPSAATGDGRMQDGAPGPATTGKTERAEAPAGGSRDAIPPVTVEAPTVESIVADEAGALDPAAESMQAVPPPPAAAQSAQSAQPASGAGAAVDRSPARQMLDALRGIKTPAQARSVAPGRTTPESRNTPRDAARASARTPAPRGTIEATPPSGHSAVRTGSGLVDQRAANHAFAEAAGDVAPWDDVPFDTFADDGLAGPASGPASGPQPAPTPTRRTAGATEATAVAAAINAGGQASVPPTAHAAPEALAEAGFDAAAAVSLAPLGLAGDWPALAASLPLRGLAQQLALQSELSACHDGGVTLTVPVATLGKGGHVDKVAEALAERLGRPCAVVVAVGPARHTAALVETARRAALQAEAERLIADDPFVQTLVRDFDGSVVPGSIKPIVR